MFQFKSYKQEYTEWQVEIQLSFYKENHDGNGNPDSLQNPTWIRKLTYSKQRRRYGNLDVYSNLVRSRNPDLDRNSVRNGNPGVYRNCDGNGILTFTETLTNTESCQMRKPYLRMLRPCRIKILGNPNSTETTSDYL